MIERLAVLLARTGAPTRRALLGLGVGIAALPGLTMGDAKKKRKKRKKRCKKLRHACSIGGKRKCCNGRSCDVVGPDGLGPARCCQPNLGLCQGDSDCCGLSTCVDDGAGPRCLFILQP